MNQFYLILLTLPSLIYSICNHYYQSSGPSSTKRPFDICYHSEYDEDTLKPSSYRYICIESTAAEYGNNSVNGFTAFREDFNTIDCGGKANQTRIVSQPYKILCENSSPQCDVLRLRQYPIINASKCSYNESVYAEDIDVIGICDDNGGDSEAIFCNKGGSSSSYFWTNTYYGGVCDAERLFEAAYQFHGCQGDGETYLEILGCDVNYGGINEDVEPFNDGAFVAGFVLLLIAILCILFILVWYCCWFRKGFTGGGHQKGTHVRATSHNPDGRTYHDDDDDEDGVEMNETGSMR
mmetsp:Transcript_27240/g.24065  ORF Transcript_27240/g.24065 Transcript_27240/m.24065 type:complete len:294 (-) Transcript_27240:181-1062(-)